MSDTYPPAPPPTPPWPPQAPSAPPGYAAPPSAPQPPAPPGAPQPAAPPRRPAKPILIIAGIALLLFTCCCLVMSAGLLSNCSGGGITKQDWQLTDDQRAVLRDYGPPDTFSVYYTAPSFNPTTGAEPEAGTLVRFETWEYYQAGSQWSFDNGAMVARRDIAETTQAVAFPKLRPEQFGSGMSLSELAEVIGAEPDRDVDMSISDLEGLSGYGWRGQVVTLLQEDRMVSIQTFPVPKGGAK